MKRFILIALLFAFATSFCQDLRTERWKKEVFKEKIVFTKLDSISIQCCRVSNEYGSKPDIRKHLYTLTIETGEILTNREIRKRKKRKSFILDSLENLKTDVKRDKAMIFKEQHNYYKKLRLHIFNKGKAIYLHDYLETPENNVNGYFRNKIEFLEILEKRKEIFDSLNIPYQEPIWQEKYERVKRNYFMSNDSCQLRIRQSINSSCPPARGDRIQYNCKPDSFSLKIFNRFGNLVFETDDIDVRLDEIVNNKEKTQNRKIKGTLPSGVYFYIIWARFPEEKEIVKTDYVYVH